MSVIIKNKLLLSTVNLIFVLSLFGCSDSTEEQNKTSASATSPVVTTNDASIQTPFAYVKRSVNSQASSLSQQLSQKFSDIEQSPVEFLSPYQFSIGAALHIKSGLDVNALDTEVLTSYFGTSNYDVKDLSVDSEGKRLVLSARGDDNHPTDSSWNIFVYNFETKLLSRVISSNLIANSGHDTSPVITADNQIVFSSDRDAGNPSNPRPNSELVGQSCRKVDPKENPSLIHTMSINGLDITQLTYGRKNHDLNTTLLNDGRVAFIRWQPEYLPNAMCKPETSTISGNKVLANGLLSPSLWSEGEICNYSKVTQDGVVSVSNNFKVLTLSADGNSMQQLYDTATGYMSDESLLGFDQLVQAENGQLVSLLRHHYNSALGGDMVEFGADTSNSANVFNELPIISLTEPTVDLYPEQHSLKGWFSALAPYRDGSSRMLVSWAQCIIQENGVSRFCDATQVTGTPVLRYGIWVYNPATHDRSPIVRADNDTVYSDIAMARPHVGNSLNITPFNPNFVDNQDATRIVCNINNAPVANAGVDQVITIGDEVILDGAQSYDVDADPITFHWQVIEQAADSNPALSYSSMSKPQLILDKVGTYQISLVVDDGDLKSQPDTIKIEVQPINRAPVANAGDDQSVTQHSSVTLNGSESFDPDNESITYLWQLKSQPTNSNISLSDASSINPQFPATHIGDYVFELVVSDGKTVSTADSVSIMVIPVPNNQPVANAGSDKQNYINEAVQLDGTQSYDTDGDTLSYRWTLIGQPEGASVNLENSATVTPSFSANLDGSYYFQLIVNDGKIDSEIDTVAVSLIAPVNEEPIANAGFDLNGIVNQAQQLNGSSSYDPEGQALTYSWTLISSPTGSNYNLTNSSTVNPMFSGNMVGLYNLQLIVNDGVYDSSADLVTVELTRDNTRPVANAGADQFVQVNQTVMLDGSASSDLDGDSLSYNWRIISPADSNAVLSNASSVSPSISLTNEQSLVIQLTVNDGYLDSEPDMVELRFDNAKPVANAGNDQQGNIGDLLTLDASNSSDGDGDPLTYSWALVSAPEDSVLVLSDYTSVMPTLLLDQEGSFVFELIVNDGQQDSDADSVIINTLGNSKPIANAGPDQTRSVGDEVLLDGQASFDGDGDPLTYRWDLINKPDNSGATLINSNQLSASLNIDIGGEYVVQLIVNDGQLDSLPDTMLISMENLRPVAEAGPTQTVTSNTIVVLDGSASRDPNNDPLTYRWAMINQPQNSSATLVNPDEVHPVFTPSVEGIYVVQLIVNDGTSDSLADTVAIEVKNIPQLCELYPFTLGEDTFANVEIGDDLSKVPFGNGYGHYGWLTWNGSNSANTLARSLVSPGNSQNYRNPVDEFDTSLDTLDWVHGAPGVKNSRSVRQNLDRLIGRDLVIPVWSETTGQGSQFLYQVARFVTIEVTDYQLNGHGWLSFNYKGDANCENLAPNADAGPSQNVLVNTQVVLDGSASQDPENDLLTYQWTLIEKPAASNTLLFNADSVSPDFIVDVNGVYVAQLIVNDGQLNSTPSTVSIEASDEGQYCEVSDDTQLTFPVTIRDFTPNRHPDFQAYLGQEYGIVMDSLGIDGLPQYRGGEGAIDGNNIGSPTTTGEIHFDQWYRDTPGVNLTIAKSLTLHRDVDSTIWEYNNEAFFPINDEGFGNYQDNKNYHFTMEAHFEFDYKGGETFTFRGDDDLWLFINGKLAVDIGGVHSAVEKTIDIDAIALELGIEPNNNYSFDLFFAERHTVRSTFSIQTNIDLQCIVPN